MVKDIRLKNLTRHEMFGAKGLHQWGAVTNLGHNRMIYQLEGHWCARCHWLEGDDFIWSHWSHMIRRRCASTFLPDQDLLALQWCMFCETHHSSTCTKCARTRSQCFCFAELERGICFSWRRVSLQLNVPADKPRAEKNKTPDQVTTLLWYRL